MSLGGKRTVVIAGGGVAALEAALTLRDLAEDRVSVEIIAPEPHFWYRPTAVAEPFGLGEVAHLELAELASAAGASFTLGTLVSVDARRHLLRTSAGVDIPYDSLLIACGGFPRPAIPGALTFRGPADTPRMAHLLSDIDAGTVRRVAFAVPWGTAWILPLYELALLTATHVAARGVSGVELLLVTPEDAPLRLFGDAASDAITQLLDERGVTVHTGVYPLELSNGELRLTPEGAIPADRVVALPRLQGLRIDGVSQTVDGFIPVDPHGRVVGLADVYAAGDITTFPVKQGGIAAQQAEAAALAIAAAAGAELTARPFEPVLRGLLLTGSGPRYLRRELASEDERSSASEEPLWWPPAKIVGRRLSPFLADHAGAQLPTEPPSRDDAVSVEVALGVSDVDRLVLHGFDLPVAGSAAVSPGGDGSRRVAEVMSNEPLVVAPEDTVGEVAEKMRALDAGSALVAHYGRLVGILTAADLLRALAGRVHSSEARVREWMTAEPVSVSTESTLDVAALLMTEHGIHQLAVVDGERPVGIVALRDVARPVLTGRLSAIGLGF